ncbi:Rid family hydrolase [Microbacter sp. GSS18]|nr:Rid family hydrolase [Microbacter sp. GSS18]
MLNDGHRNLARHLWQDDLNQPILSSFAAASGERRDGAPAVQPRGTPGGERRRQANGGSQPHTDRTETDTPMKRTLVSNGNPMEMVVGFSRAVRVGPYVCVGGTAPVGQDGRTVGVGDAAAQARRCLEIIQTALEDAGARLEDVVRTRVLLTRIEDWKAVIDARAAFFAHIRPVDTIMQVQRFVNPEWLVEFEVDAVISDGTPPDEVGPR